MAQFYNSTQYRSVGQWHTSYGGQVPYHQAVVGGNDLNGEPIYVGRAVEGSDLVPGKVVPSHHCCYIAHNGREIPHQTYQVLTNPFGCELVWIHASNGEIPLGALQGGRQANGETLYIGRANYQGSIVIGKVHRSHRVLYISFDGREVPISHYEVLCAKEIPF